MREPDYFKEWQEYYERYKKAKKDNPLLDYYLLPEYIELRKREVEPNFVIHHEDDCEI